MAVLLMATVRLAQAEATNAPAIIGAREADKHYDQLLTVTGTVAQVSIRSAIVFINLDQPYPDSPFVAIIHSSDTNQFNDPRTLMGRSVAITGKVQNYRDRPEIVLEKPAQITVSGGWPTATKAPATPPVAVPPPPATFPKGTNDLTTGVM